jgi:hypothetical protein
MYGPTVVPLSLTYTWRIWLNWGTESNSGVDGSKMCSAGTHRHFIRPGLLVTSTQAWTHNRWHLVNIRGIKTITNILILLLLLLLLLLPPPPLKQQTPLPNIVRLLHCQNVIQDEWRNELCPTSFKVGSMDTCYCHYKVTVNERITFCVETLTFSM